MVKCRLTTRGEATSSRPSPFSTEHFVVPIPERLLRRLRKVDPEQLQVVEIVAAAIERGAIVMVLSLSDWLIAA
jgi:hypothetical protein